MAQLSTGSLESIIMHNVTNAKPVVQVMNIKPVNVTGQQERYRMNLSDGVHLQSCMAATQLNPLFRDNKLVNNCIVRVTEYVTNVVQNKRLLIVLGIEVLHPPMPQVGNPVSLAAGGAVAGGLGNGGDNGSMNQPVSAAHGGNLGMNGMNNAQGGMNVMNNGNNAFAGRNMGPGNMQSHPNNDGFQPQAPKQSSGGNNNNFQANYGGLLHQNQNQNQNPNILGGNQVIRPNMNVNNNIGSNNSGPFGGSNSNGNANQSNQRFNMAPNANNQEGAPNGGQSFEYQQQQRWNSNQGASRNPYPASSSGPIARMNAPPIGNPSMAGGSGNYTPIARLNPYQNSWTIRGRVSYKSDLRKYQNEKGEGTIFSFELADDTASIKISSFRDVAERFHKLIEMNKVYSVRGGQLKAADQRYNRSTSEFEITLDSRSDIKNLVDDGSIRKMQFKLIKLNELESVPLKTTCDLMAIVTDCSDIVTLNSKSSGQMLEKRTLTLVDDSGVSVPLTLWGQCANQFNTQGMNAPVLLCKGVRRGDYQGVSLDNMQSTYLELNPDSPEAHHLRGWYDSMNGQIQVKPLGGRGGYAGGGNGVGSERRYLADVIDSDLPARLQYEQKGVYYTTRARIRFIKKSGKLYYEASPDSGRKVTEIAPGQWRSEYDDRVYDRCDYRYILSANVADPSGNCWMSMFDDTAITVLGRPASDIAGLQPEDPTVAHMLAGASRVPFVFRIRAKNESYQGSERVKHQILKAEPVNFAEESKALLAEIQELSGGAS